MNTTKHIAVAGLMALVSLTATAQPHLRHHYVHHRPHTTVVNVHTSNNQLQRSDRFDMAMAYLKNNRVLTAKKYAKLTGLTHATAEAELDVFASDRKTPIRLIVDGKKKRYTLA